MPSIERSKLLFPINLPDFVFQEGVEVLSYHEVEKRQSQPDTTEFFDGHTAFISPFGNYPIQQNALQRELLYTNQEGKMYYAACYDYFLDLNDIEEELRRKGHFQSG